MYFPPLHKGVICKFPVWCIYYCHSSESTRKLAKCTSVHCPKDPKLQIRFMNSAVGLSLYHLIPDYVLRSGAKTLSLFHVIFHLFPLIDRHIQPPGIGYSVIYTFFPFCKQNSVSRIFAPKKHMYLPQGQVGSRVSNLRIRDIHIECSKQFK